MTLKKFLKENKIKHNFSILYFVNDRLVSHEFSNICDVDKKYLKMEFMDVTYDECTEIWVR